VVQFAQAPAIGFDELEGRACGMGGALSQLLLRWRTSGPGSLVLEFLSSFPCSPFFPSKPSAELLRPRISLQTEAHQLFLDNPAQVLFSAASLLADSPRFDEHLVSWFEKVLIPRPTGRDHRLAVGLPCVDKRNGDLCVVEAIFQVPHPQGQLEVFLIVSRLQQSLGEDGGPVLDRGGAATWSEVGDVLIRRPDAVSPHVLAVQNGAVWKLYTYYIPYVTLLRDIYQYQINC